MATTSRAPHGVDSRKSHKDKSSVPAKNTSLSSITPISMDMYEEAGQLVATVRLPGFKKEEIKVSTDDGMLTVRAEHTEDTLRQSARHYYMKEINKQYFRRVPLPDGVDVNDVDAKFTDNVLTIVMPLASRVQAKTVTIR